jgi:hypothetical protein
VRPPEVEKKNVVATCPFHVRMRLDVRATASFVRDVSYPIPPYTWLRSSEKTSKCRLGFSVASAYDRAATACASSAAMRQRSGISPPTTPRA